jgi:hypothetical protein
VHVKLLFRRKYEQDATRNHPHLGDTRLVKDDYVAPEITRPLHSYFSSGCVLRTMLMSHIADDTIKAEEAGHKRMCKTLKIEFSRVWQEGDIPRVNSGANIKLC